MEMDCLLTNDENEGAITSMMQVLEDIHHSVEETLVSLQKSFGVRLPRVETTMKAPNGRREGERRSFVRGVSSMIERHGSAKINQHILEKSKTIQGWDKSPHFVTLGSGVKYPVQKVESDNNELVYDSKQSQNQFTSLTENSAQSAREIISKRDRMAGQAKGVISPMRTPESTSERGTERKCNNKKEEKATSSPGFAVIRQIPSTVKRTLGVKTEDGDPALTELNVENFDRYEYMVDSIMTMLEDINRTGHVIDKAFVLSMRDSKGEIEILHEKLSIKNEKIEELEKELNAQTREMEIAQNEVDDLRQRVKSMTEAILRHEDLGYEVKRLEDEKEEWKIQEQKLTREITLLSQQLEEIASKAQDECWGTKDGTCLKEIVAVKKRNRQLECQILAEAQRSKQLESKLTRRLTITDQNWQKAELEAKDLDNIIQTIRKICLENRSTRQSPVFLRILQLIDGQTDSTLENSHTSVD